MSKTFYACMAMTLIFCACGKQHKAEETVETFLAANLRAEGYSADFTKIDSTTLVSDSMVNVMRKAAAANKAFKSPIRYGAEPPQPSYTFTKTHVIVGDDTLRHTFYLSPDLSKVVAFKEN